MYSRNYYADSQDGLSLPENYDGTAFMNNAPPDVEEETAQPVFNEAHSASAFERPGGPKAKPHHHNEKPSLLSGIFGHDGLFGNLGLSMPNFGTEEILIIATAAFLFFSKSGDKECALLLLLLLFIN